MKDVYIFDLDGTLALIEHRRHLVTGPNPDWRAFFAACVRDDPYHEVIDTLLALYNANYIVWVWSGRSDEVRLQTEAWLYNQGVQYHELRMRPAGDHQPDEKLKASWLADVDREQYNIVAVFEDRDRMVKLWRDNGIACFQVAPGDF